MKSVNAFVAGLIFALGLGLAGMVQVDNIVGFLDLTRWDPTLAFVMIGAIAVHSVAYRYVAHRDAPMADTRFHMPTRQDIDAPLLSGAALFGAGWALAGFCPGPGIVSLSAGHSTGLVFFIGMVGGMLAFRAYDSLGARHAAEPAKVTSSQRA